LYLLLQPVQILIFATMLQQSTLPQSHGIVQMVCAQQDGYNSSLDNAAHPLLLDRLPMLTLECTDKILGEDLPQGQLADVLFSFRLNSLGILSVLMMRLVVRVGVE
jgi:hypothetical protein